MLGNEGPPALVTKLRLMAEDAFNCDWLTFDHIPYSDQIEMLIKLDVDRRIKAEIASNKAVAEGRTDGLGSGVMPKDIRKKRNIVITDAPTPVIPETPSALTPLPPVTLETWGKAEAGTGVMKRR